MVIPFFFGTVLTLAATTVPTPALQRVIAPGGAVRLVVLTGRVAGSRAGRPQAVAGASVQLRAAAGPGSPVVASVVSDASGRYRFENPGPDAAAPVAPAPPPDISAGRYELWAHYHTVVRDLGPVVIPGTATTTRDIALGDISGSGGAPTPGASRAFYATDREPIAGASDFLKSFANKRINTPCFPTPACVMAYGSAVPVDPIHFSAQPAPDVNGLTAMIRSSFPAATSVLIYVHGYNNDFRGPYVTGATWLAAYDPKMPVIVYSWPSNATTVKYLDDETNNGWAADHFRDFLVALLASPNRPPRVHILAHSMGNRLVIGALDYLAASHASTSGALGQVIFAAPDVDAGTFYEDLPAMAGVAQGITVYGSTHDEALRLSRQLHGHCRAGIVDCDETVPANVGNVNAIDASLFECDFFGHGYWNSSSTMRNDIVALLSGGVMTPAAVRPHLAPAGAPNRYKFVEFDPGDTSCGASANDPAAQW